MTTKRVPLGIGVDDRYRTIPAGPIIETIMLVGWGHDTGSPEAWEAAGVSLRAWMQSGLGFKRSSKGEPLFDPVEVFNFMKRAGLEGRDGFWSERLLPTRRRLISEWAAGHARDARNDGGRRFTVDFKRTFNLTAMPAGSRLRLRAPLPLTGDYLDDLEVEPFAGTGGDAQVQCSAGRIEVRMVATGEAEATIGARLSFAARLQEPSQLRVSGDHENALYLAEREGLVIVSERVRALAGSLAPVGVPAQEAVRSFWEFINGELISGAIHYDQIDLASPCDWILDARWFDCQLGSSLFVALCRARGIPARLVGGYLLYRVSPTNHYWSEVWIEGRGWTPFDFLAWDICRAGRDPELQERFFGHLDYRMTCERLPRVFTGAIGVPIPPAWCLIQSPRPGGAEIRFLDLGGKLIYADSVRVSG